MTDLKIHSSWKKELQPFIKTSEFENLTKYIRKEYMDKEIYPEPKNVFNAFDLCPFDEVKVVILGQDPYHGKGQAHGLAFSVPEGIAPPPSLQNIFKEIESDIGSENMSTDLTRWAQQGVFLLNSILTVIARSPTSHSDSGWEVFTDFVIKRLSDKREHLVFMLWGSFAKSKSSYIDQSKHLILEAVHPSPLSANNGFFGCKHFSKANKYLEENGLEPIDW